MFCTLGWCRLLHKWYTMNWNALRYLLFHFVLISLSTLKAIFCYLIIAILCPPLFHETTSLVLGNGIGIMLSKLNRCSSCLYDFHSKNSISQVYHSWRKIKTHATMSEKKRSSSCSSYSCFLCVCVEYN